MIALDLLILKFEIFLVILFRIMGMLIMLPVYGEKGMPQPLKIGIGLFLAYMILPMTWDSNMQLPTSLGPLTFALAGEALFGIMIGFIVKLLLSATHVAGQLLGFQMGFAIVNVIDPSGQNVSLIARFQDLIATAIFFAMGMDHIFLAGVLESFQVIPPLGFHLTVGGIQVLIDQSVEMWIIAIQLAGPVMIALFATKVAIGLVSRAVPQMNVFIVGFPISIGVGLTLLGLSLPMFVHFMKTLFRDLLPVIQNLLNQLA